MGIGEGSQKESDLRQDDIFVAPLEYINLYRQSLDKSDEYYININRSTKFYSNTELFIKNNGRWTLNNIRSMNKLVYRTQYPELQSIKNIYEYIGKPEILRKYPLII